MKINKLFFIAVLLLAAFLRLWKLGSIPPSLDQDEASLGYNAYSILLTGKDEYGKTLPVIFKSFGDYKPGLYVYLDIPFVASLGLNEVSTRLPSAVAGIISVWLIYLISKKLFPDHPNLPSMAAFVAAVNPYLIYFSRAAWEANVSLTLTLAGVYFFLKALKKAGYLILSLPFFALTLVAYQGAKLSTLIVAAILTILYRKEIMQFLGNQKRVLSLSFLLSLIIAAPILLSFFRGQTSRLSVYSIFSYRRPATEITEILNQGKEKITGASFLLFHSEELNYKRAILGRYFNNFSPRFLFFEGDWANPISTAPYQGVMLIGDLLLLPLGLFAVFRKKVSRETMLILFWLVLAPLSACLARDDINAVRDLNLAVPLVYLSAFGLNMIFESLKKKFSGGVAVFTIMLFYIFPVIYFTDAYFVHVPQHYSFYWRYGYREAVNIISRIQPKYQKIIFEQSYNQPYIFFLYYQKYDPVKYQNNSKLAPGGNPLDVGFVKKLDKINFEDIDWQAIKNEHGVLVAASPRNLPPDFLNDAVRIGEVKYVDGRSTAFEILEIK